MVEQSELNRLVVYLKSILLKRLPDRVLIALKKVHYPRAVRRFRSPHAPALRALVRPGDSVLDLGANIGWYTRVLSELVGQCGRVYSVEPLPPTFALLQHCICRLSLLNVTPVHCAVSDRVGSAMIEIPLYPGGAENTYQAHIVDGGPAAKGLRTFVVPLSTVDTLFLELARSITFIKCDVEGKEWPVLLGAARLIERSKPALLLELTTDPDEPNSNAHQLTMWLANLGYRPYLSVGASVVERRLGDQLVDYLFLTDRHAHMLGDAGIKVASEH